MQSNWFLDVLKICTDARELSKSNKQWFSVLSTAFEHSRIVFSTWRNARALDRISCFQIFLRARNSPAKLKTVLSMLNHCLLTYLQFTVYSIQTLCSSGFKYQTFQLHANHTGASGQLSCYGRKPSETIFTNDFSSKYCLQALSSSCMTDFFCKSMAASNFYDDRKSALRGTMTS